MDTSRVHPWLLLVYKVPRDPSGGRVFVWRNLKQLGAVLLHDSVWVLPRLPWTRNRLQWLASEIGELGGEATLWEARLEEGDRRALIQKFLDQSDAAYSAILSDLAREDANVDALLQRYEQAKNCDYFESTLGERTQKAIQARIDRDARAEI